MGLSTANCIIIGLITEVGEQVQSAGATPSYHKLPRVSVRPAWHEVAAAGPGSNMPPHATLSETTGALFAPHQIDQRRKTSMSAAFLDDAVVLADVE